MNEKPHPRDMRIYGSLSTEKLPERAPTAEEWECQFWNPRVRAHMRYEYSGKTPDGWGLQGFREFPETPAEVWIPVVRRVSEARTSRLHTKAFEEMDGLTDKKLLDEPYHEFYRHMDMLITYDQRDTMRRVALPVLSRIHKEGDAFTEDLYTHPYDQSFVKRFQYLRALCYLDTCAEDPSFLLPQDMVKDYYEDGVKKFGGYLRYVQEFDNRNAQYGQSFDAEGKIREYMQPLLVDDTLQGFYKVEDVLSDADSNLISNLFISSLLTAENPSQVYLIVQKFVPRFGVESVRKRLREYMADNANFRPYFDNIFDYLGLDKGREIAVSVDEVYKKSSVDMTEDYGPYNETLGTDLEILTEQLQGKSKILDHGCGNGRILKPLAKKLGTEIVGYDAFEPDIRKLREESESLDVRLGTWFDIPFADESFEAGYCMGRSLTHNTTIPDMVRSLAEMRRVTAKDGFIIVDMPDPTVGEYKHFIEETQKYVQENGLFQQMLPGTIIDSPDGEHYFDRYAPNERAFQALAYFAGLHAEKLPIEKEYTGATGDKAVNTYWKLSRSIFGVVPSYMRGYLLLEDIMGGELGPHQHIM